MHWQQRSTAPVELTRHADIAMRQGEPSRFFRLVASGDWANDPVKKVRRLETEAVDRAQGLFRGENYVVSRWSRLIVAKLAKLGDNESYWPPRYGRDVLWRRLLKQMGEI